MLTKPKLFISNYDDLNNPYYSGGGAVSIHEVAKRLTANFFVTVITGSYPGSSNQLIEDVNYKRIGLAFGGPFLGQISFLLCLPFVLLTANFDIWLESFVPPISSPFLNLLTSKPVIGLVHMLPARDMERKYHLPFHLWENLILKSRQNFIVLTDQTASEIKKINPTAKVSTIPNGVYLPNLKSVPPRHILYLGRLEYNQKGLDLLLEAYSQARLSMPLVIAGSGEFNRVQDKASELGVSAKVKLVGKVSGSQKDKLYREAFFVVVSSRFETFSLVALETMSYSKPVICFDITGLNWIPGSAGIKVKPFDVSSLSAAMKKLSSETAFRNKLGQSGRRTSLKFSWDSIAGDYFRILNSLL